MLGAGRAQEARARGGAVYSRPMAEVLISFLDGELLHAEVGELTFDHPLLEAEMRGVDPNNERALLSLAAIRQIVVGDAEPLPPADELAGWDRAAFHFNDGQVMRASISPDATLGHYGGVWRTVEPGAAELRTIAIPYSALKGIFRVRQWDSRPLSERSSEGRVEQLARILSERANQPADGGRPPRPLISRVRRGSKPE